MDFLYSNRFINNSTQNIKLNQWRLMKILKSIYSRKSYEKKGRKVKMTKALLCHIHILRWAAGSCCLFPRLSFHPRQKRYQWDCPDVASICIHPDTWGKYPAWHPFFAELQERIPLLYEASLPSKIHVVVRPKKKHRKYLATAEGTL